MFQETYSDIRQGRVHIWDVSRLKQLARDLPVQQVQVAGITELDSEMWFGGPRSVRPTCRAVAEHAKRIWSVDPTIPIILSAEGKVMDGMHRIAKVWLSGAATIPAVRFLSDPSPDVIR